MLTDKNVRNLQLGRANDGTFAAEVCARGRIFKRSGFASLAEAYRWASRQVYGEG